MKKKSSRKRGAANRSCAGPSGSASVVSALRADADSWEACGKALGYIDDEGERRGKERVAMLRRAAELIESLEGAMYHLKGIVNEIAAITKRNQKRESVIDAVRRVAGEPNK